jgi:hypothetical protein
MQTGGWDTVFTADIELINEALKRNSGKLITSFDISQNGFSAKGAFGPWKIVEGGSDVIVNLQLPITSGALTGPSGRSIDICGTAVVLSVHLALLPTPSGDSQNLVFSFK